MNRNYGKEIDEINGQLAEIKNLLTELAKQPQKRDVAKPLKNIEPMRNMHPDKRLSEMMEELCEKTDENGNTGFITYLGVFSSGDRQSNWISNQVNTDRLLELIESNIAAKVLACIGNNDRLNMLLALLRAPRTAAQLVEECGYNTTGQVYHHLKPLIAANIVSEDKGASKGTYFVRPQQVRGIIMLLAGVHDMVASE